MDHPKTERVTLEEAAEWIRKRTDRLPAVTKKLGALSDDILAEDVYARIDQPPFPRSPLDGYAFRGEDSAGAGAKTPAHLKVIDKIYAGGDNCPVIHAGEAARLMTGARIPDGADAVIRQEDTDLGADTVALYREIKPYENYCFQGEDFTRGTRLLEKETALNFAAVAVLAGNGIAEVQVIRKPGIAVISTGDELIQPGEELRPGKIYDSNLFMVCARLRELGIECWGVHIGDEAQAVQNEILHQLEIADAVITTGGVSVGEKDVMNMVLSSLKAEMLFTGLKLKPGSPSKYALVQGKPLLALSGNPFAASAVLELLGRPMLEALTGSDAYRMRRTKAVFQNGLTKSSPGRRFIRGRYLDGIVTNPSGNSSGQICSMLGCNCLIDILAGSGPVSPGSEVDILML